MKRIALVLLGLACCASMGVPAAQARRVFMAAIATTPTGSPVSDYWAFAADGGVTVETWDLRDGADPIYDTAGAVTMTVPAQGVIYDPTRGQLVVAGSQSLEIQDIRTFPAAVPAAVASGSMTVQDLVSAPDHSVYYVLNSDTGTGAEIKSIDPANGNVTATIALTGGGATARQLLFVPAFGGAPNQLWVSYGTTNYHRVQLTGLALPAVGPSVTAGTDTVSGMVVDPSGSRVLVVGGYSGAPLPYYPYFKDVQTGATSAFTMGITPTYDEFSMVTVRPQGDYAYAVGNQFNSSNPGGFVIDLATSTIVAEFGISVTNQCTFGQVDPSGRILVTGNGADNTFFDIETDPALPAVAAGSFYATKAGVRRMAFATPSRPVVDRISISGGTGVAGDPFRLEGSGFNPATLSVTVGFDTLQVTSATTTTITAVMPVPMYTYFDGRNDIVVSNGPHSLAQQVVMNGYTVGTTTPFFTLAQHPGGETQNDYRMLGFSAIVPAGAAKQALEAVLGPYDPEVWRLFVWDAKAQSYVEYSALTDPSDWTGQGYWLLSRLPAVLLAAAIDTVGTYYDRFPLTLQPGWNLIASPYDADTVTWNDWHTTVSLLPASGNDQPAMWGISDPIWWDGTQYLATSTLVGGRGYWVYNPHPVTMWLHLTTDGFIGSVPADRPLGADDPVPPAPPGSASSGGSSAACAAASREPGPWTAVPVGLMAVLIVAAAVAKRRAVQA